MANLRANNLTGTGGRNAIDGSVYFQGYVDGVASDYLKIPDSDDLDMGTGDFTFECWLNAVNHVGTNSPNFMGIFSSGAFTAGGFLIQVNNTGPLRLVIPLAAGGNFEQSAGPSLWGSWNHIVVVKTSNVIKGFVNGVEVISASHSVGIDFAHGGYATVGENCYVTYPGDYPLRGHVSNLRLIKGTALYTAAFTPPTQKLTAVENTVLLCCQDSNDALQEATGKTITGQGRYEYLSGTNLVTNGSGNSVSGWTDANTSTFASTGGRIQVTRSGGVGNCSYQAITTIVGQQYTIRANIEKGSGSYGDIRVYTDSGFGTFLVILRSDANTSGLRETTFTATTTTTHLTFVIDSNGETAYYSNISVIAANPGKAPRFLPPYGIDEGVAFDGGIKKNTQGYMYFPTGDTEQRGRGRCIFSNGAPGSQALYYLQMQSGGIAQSFGNLANAAALSGGCGSSIRMLVADGYISPASTNIIEYITIATTSNGRDYGDLTVARRRPIGMSNTTRGVWAGGSNAAPTPYLNEIDYNTIASLGNATDFGDVSGTTAHGGGVSSSTRGIFSLAYSGGSNLNTLEYITFATTGNSQDFGDLNAGKAYHFRGCSSSDSTRGLFAGGYNPSNNNIDFITMASTGDAVDFGDLTVARRSGMATGNSIDAIFVGGYIPGASNTIDRVTIQTTGNAVDYGDLPNNAKFHEGACSSDSHGGLS